MCGVSGSLEELVFWRIVQGLGGGGLISTSQAILRETFPLREQGKAQGIFAMGVIVGPTLGPSIGGWITDNSHGAGRFSSTSRSACWRRSSCGCTSAIRPRRGRCSLDRWGLALLAVGIGSMQYVLDQGQQKDWFADESIVACSVVAILGLVAFVLWELFGTKSRSSTCTCCATGRLRPAARSAWCSGSACTAACSSCRSSCRGSLGFTATDSGELLVMRAAAVALVTPLRGRRCDARQGRTRIHGGARDSACSGFRIHAGPGDDDRREFLDVLLAARRQRTRGFADIRSAFAARARRRRRGERHPGGAAFFNLARQIGGSFAIAVLVTIIGRQHAIHQTNLAPGSRRSRPAVARFLRKRRGTLRKARHLTTEPHGQHASARARVRRHVARHRRHHDRAVPAGRFHAALAAQRAAMAIE